MATTKTTNDVVVLKVFEGQFDNNSLVEIANGGTDALTNFSWFNPLNFNFATTNNTLTLTNVLKSYKGPPLAAAL